MQTFSIMLDSECYTSKPTTRDASAITKRLQRSGPTEVTADELACAIRQGRAWMAGMFAPSDKGWGAFRGVRLWALDCDNHEGDRQLTPSDDGFIWPENIRQRLVSLGFKPLLCHSTAHASKDKIRFRTIFDIGETVTDEAEAREVVALVLKHFPECDQSCKNTNRLFFGAAKCGIYPYSAGAEVWPS